MPKKPLRKKPTAKPGLKMKTKVKPKAKPKLKSKSKPEPGLLWKALKQKQEERQIKAKQGSAFFKDSEDHRFRPRLNSWNKFAGPRRRGAA